MSISSPINIASPKRNPSSSISLHGYPIHGNQNFYDTDFNMSPMMNNCTTSYDSNPARSRQDPSTAAKPISMHNPSLEDRLRRDSQVANLAQGTSWGGTSVGSWIRDDMLMTGTSPFPYQSPSFNSSSYLPKLEASFMRDFACCGNTLPTLHDLLQHYEESHAQQTSQSTRSSTGQRTSENSSSNSKALNMPPTSVAYLASRSQQQQNKSSQPKTSCAAASPETSRIGGIQLMRQQDSQHQQSLPSTPTHNKAGMGSDEMELDDNMSSLGDAAEVSPVPTHTTSVKGVRQSLFGQAPPFSLNLNTTNLQYSGLRTSQSSTPASAGFSYQNNPTVSSVNTPTLSAQPMNYNQQFSPTISRPGTPSVDSETELYNPCLKLNTNIADADISNFTHPYSLGGAENIAGDYCIDEPAKRLYSPNGLISHRLQQQLAQFGLNQGGLSQSEALLQAQRIQQSIILGHPHPAAALMMISEEHKPFRCPVIGCEKAYKNQNGLKYHKTHGHNTQQLHENGDGTFSIVNPETSIPYPGTMGMEKEKPFRCEVCCKRYKNLNGLKYHKQHSPSCNLDLNFDSHMSVADMGSLGMNFSGLCDIGEVNLIP